MISSAFAMSSAKDAVALILIWYLFLPRKKYENCLTKELNQMCFAMMQNNQYDKCHILRFKNEPFLMVLTVKLKLSS